jgi:protein SCO1/2
MILSLLAGLLACGPTAAPLPVLGDVPAFTLTDATGATVTDQALRGKVWVADFFFTSCPDVCPLLSAHLAEVQAHYAADDRVRLVSFSVDPGTDTPAVLAAYGARFSANPARWYLLTGPIDAMKAVVVDGFKMVLERIPAATDTPAPAPATVLHGERFVVVDRDGRLRGYPDPREPGKVELYADVDALLAE